MNIQFIYNIIYLGDKMKRCPNCSAIFEDNMMIKCTNCGCDLVEERQEQPTYNNVPPQYKYPPHNAYNSNFKICPRCGNHCDPRAVICVKCGIQFQDFNNAPQVDDKPTGIIKALCFFVPILGLILYLVNMNDKPVSAKAYGKMSLIGFIVGIVAYVLLVVVFGVLLSFTGIGFSSSPAISTYPDSSFFYSIINQII